MASSSTSADPSWIEKNAFPSIVKVYVTEKGTGASRGCGTAFCIHRSGLFLSCAHVLPGDSTNTEYLLWKDIEPKFKRNAVLLAKDPALDLGLLKLAYPAVAPLSIGSSDNLRVGDPIDIIGSPNDYYDLVATRGILSSKKQGTQRLGKNYTVFRTDAAANPGMSGCPVFSRNQVVGVFSNQTLYYFQGDQSRLAHEQNGSLFIPIDDVKLFLTLNFNTLPADAKSHFGNIYSEYEDKAKELIELRAKERK